jgi:5-methylcytosine-specific restriction endonuclease McrA
MPYMKNGKRDYKRENELYNSRPEQIKARTERTLLRREADAKGITHKGDGKDLDHKKPLSKGGSNTLANARATTQAANRSFSRNADGSLRNQLSTRERKAKHK